MAYIIANLKSGNFLAANEGAPLALTNHIGHAAQFDTQGAAEKVRDEMHKIEDFGDLTILEILE